MRGKRIFFYADKSDLKSLLSKISEGSQYKYIPTYRYEDEFPEFLSNPLKIPNYWSADKKDDMYLIVSENDQNEPKKFFVKTTQKFRYKVDHGTHPNSVFLTLGGLTDQNILICSKFDTLGLTDQSNEMFVKFKQIVSELTVKKRGHDYVLSGAYQKYHCGWRLTHGINYAQNMDFQDS